MTSSSDSEESSILLAMFYFGTIQTEIQVLVALFISLKLIGVLECQLLRGACGIGWDKHKLNAIFPKYWHKEYEFWLKAQ